MHNNRHKETISLAGWLFADLFLVISVIFLSSISLVPTSDALIPSPSPLPTQVTKSFLIPKPTYTPTIISTSAIGLGLEPLILYVHVDDISSFLQNNPSSEKRFLSEFNRVFPKEYRNRRAGLVIALGYHTSGNILLARQLAGHAVDVLQSNYPDVFSTVVKKTYWWDTDEAHTIGTIGFEIYFYTVDN